MTERTHSIPPQIATPTTSANHVVTSHTPKEAVAPAESVDEEPYTIKCICDFTDDDGATIYCEKCDTWQHIECFYHGMVEVASRDDFNHFCVDCQPRTLDRRKATERQRQARQDKSSHDVDEKKTKRPPSKSHKKKPRPSDLQTNGHHDHESGHNTKHGSPHDGSSHAKKTKSSHRSHHSISSTAAKRSPSHNSRQNGSGHPPSPATTPPDLPGHFVLHSYSKQLQDLYDNDPGHQELQANIASLPVTNTMSSWLRDPEKLRSDTGIENGSDVFTHPKPGFDLAALPWPELQTNSKEIAADDAIVHLRYLSVAKPIHKKDQLIGELKGTVGFQKDYYTEESDRYQKLCGHPAPFVFFHPHLPLYIDTRREGSQCRYIRRSCRPNTSLDTFIIHQSEYHFIVVTDRPLASNEEVTMAWDFRFKAHVKDRYLNLLGLSDQESTTDSELSELEYDELTELIHNLLSEYGGCACGLGSDCAFARFHRNYLGKLQTQSNGTKSKKGRKPKQHHSPASTSHATNSRDASEGRQDQYDAEDDSRSTSGSVRSKPQSRDMTPLRHGSEANGTSTDKISERDKRKIDSIEKTFEKMEQTAQPPKKKKRMSDGSATTTTSNSNTTQPAPKTKSKSVSRPSILNPTSTQPTIAARQYKDVSTSQRPSESPTSRQSPAEGISPRSRQPSVPMKPRHQSISTPSNYVTSSTQTDATSDDWFEDTRPSPPRKTIIPLSKRLLSSRHKLRAELEARRTKHEESRRASVMIGIENHPSNDAIMTDANDITSSMGKTTPDRKSSVAIESPDDAHSVQSVQLTIKSADDEDTPMLDVPLSAGKPDPPIWPESTSAASNPGSSPTMSRSPELRVQMPPTPNFANSSQSGLPTINGTVTPSSAAGAIVQSPFGSTNFPNSFSPSVLNSVGQNPSPVKKKLSLSDYRARLNKKPEPAVKTAAISDTVATPATLEPSSSLIEEPKVNGALEGSAIVETPAAIEKVVDPLAVAGSSVSEAQPLTNGTGTGIGIV